MTRRHTTGRGSAARSTAGLVAASLAAPVAAAGAIAYVDVQAVLDAAPQARAAREQLEREFASRDRELDARVEELRARREALRRDAAVMSVAQRRRREAQVRALEREVRRERDWFREDLNRRRGRLLAEVRREVKAVVRRVAESRGYDLVLTGGIAYASDATELTERIVRRLEATYRRSGG